MRMTHNSGNYGMGWSKINEEVNQILRDEELLLQQQRLSFLFARFHYIVFFFFPFCRFPAGPVLHYSIFSAGVSIRVW